MVFFTVSGGAYGLEPLVGKVGPGIAIALILLVPLLWCLPIALMVSEMASAMPREGGYYVWVRKGLGEFWGFQEGWWSICYTLVDIAIYPGLFVHYLAYFFPALADGTDGVLSWSALVRWFVALLVIGGALLVNWRGANATGRSDTLNAWLVLIPFVLIVLFWLMREGGVSSTLSTVATDLRKGWDIGLLSGGLSIVLWNYAGWDNVSTFAGEVETPERNYPRAIMINLGLVAAAYLLPVLAGIAVTTDSNVWSEAQGWPVIARALGGSWLGAIVAFAALGATYSLFNSQLLYASRLPYAMALEGWLPRVASPHVKRDGRADRFARSVLHDRCRLCDHAFWRAGAPARPALRGGLGAGIYGSDRASPERAGDEAAVPHSRRVAIPRAHYARADGARDRRPDHELKRRRRRSSSVADCVWHRYGRYSHLYCEAGKGYRGIGRVLFAPNFVVIGAARPQA